MIPLGGCDGADGGGGGGSPPAPAHLSYGAVAVADLDGDGLPDVVAANLGSIGGTCPPTCTVDDSGISVLLQDAAAHGRFQAAVNYSPSGNDTVAAVAVADINGDNRADLVIAQGSGVFVRLQDPAHPGAFLPPAPISD